MLKRLLHSYVSFYLFLIAKKWKEPKGLSMDDRKENMVHIHHKKRINPVTCDNMHGTAEHYIK
jgi:hypothetical protein